MAARSVFSSVWTALAGLNLGATRSSVGFLQRTGVPQLSAVPVQSRGIRQGETRLDTEHSMSPC